MNDFKKALAALREALERALYPQPEPARVPVRVRRR